MDFIKSTPRANPMDVMRLAVSMLGLYDSGLSDEDSRQTRTIAVPSASPPRSESLPLTFARQGLELPKVRDDLGEAAHFLYLLNGTEPSPEAKTPMLPMLHNHGMNASTFSARVTIATLAIFYSAITSQSEHSRGRFTAAQGEV